MATYERTLAETVAWPRRVVAAIVAGLVGGLLMGALFHAGGTMELIGILYGQGSDATVGWIAHMAHSLLFALIFAGVLAVGPVRRVFDGVSRALAGRLGPRVPAAIGSRLPSSEYVTGIVFGGVYAVGLWIVAFGYILPWRSGQVGFIRWQPLEWLAATAPGSLIAHLAYGIPLGIVYVALLRWSRSRP